MIDRIAAGLFASVVLFAGSKAEAVLAEQTFNASEEKSIVRMSCEPVEKLYSVPLTGEIQRHIKDLACGAGLDPAVIVAMIEVESTYNPETIGDDGNSYGLMQIQPRWHDQRMAELGVTNLLDPKQNITVGVDILSELVAKYNGNVEMALVAYNAGPTGAYRHWFSRGEYSSEYSRKVLEISRELKGES